MPKKSKEFCVLEFLERPYVYLDEFVCVPKNDILARNVINNVVFTYPINPSMRHRVFYDQWPLFLGDYKCSAGTAQKGKDICRDLVIRQRRNEYANLNDTDDSDDSSRAENTLQKRNDMKASRYGQKKSVGNLIPRDIRPVAVDDENTLNPEFIKTLRNEMEIYKKQLTDLDEAKEVISKKFCLLKAFIDKLKYYNDDTRDDKYQKLIEIIREKEEQFQELQLQVKGKNVSNHRNSSDTKWTLRYHEEGYGVFELLDDSGLFVNGVAACYILRYAQTRIELGRMLLSEVFTEEALRTCNFNSLDLDARNKLVDAAECMYRICGNLGHASKEIITRGIKNRLFAINRIPD